MIQFFQQRLGLLKISRVKPFGEPLVDLRQQLPGFCSPALLLPQASEARGGTEFERLRTQFAGGLNCFEKIRFRFFWFFPKAYSLKPRAFLRQQELAFESI